MLKPCSHHDTAIIPGLPEPELDEPQDDTRLLEAMRFTPAIEGLDREQRLHALASAQRVHVTGVNEEGTECELVPDELSRWAAQEIRTLEDQLDRLCLDLGVARGDIK